MPLWFSSEKMVKVSGHTPSVSSSQHIEVSFATEALDLGGYFNAANPTSLIIPATLAGWYQVLCTVRWIIPEYVTVTHDPAQEHDAYFYIWLKVNGSVMSNEARATANRVTNAKGTSQVVALETYFAAGDVIKLMLWHSFEPAYIEQIDALSFLSLHKVRGVSLTKLPVFDKAVLQDDKNLG